MTAEQDSLLKLLKTNIPDTVRLSVLSELTEITDDPKIWSQYNKQAKELAIRLTSSNDSETKRKANIALATAYNNEGLFYNLTGKASRAVDCLHKSLELREQLGIKSDLSETLHNLGTMYYDIGEYTLAQQYFNRSLRLSEEIKDSVNAAISLNYIGMIAIKNKDYDKALKCFEGTLSVFKNSGDVKSYATTLDNIGMAHFLLKEDDKALAFLNEAEKIQKNYDDPAILSATFRSIGTIQLNKRNTVAALNYGTLALEQAKKSGFPREIANAEELLAKVYESKKDFTNAFYHYKNFIAYHDSIKDEEARKVAIAEQLKSGYEKKAAVMKAEQEKKDALAKQEISRQKILKNALIAGVILLLLFSFVLYSRFRLKKKSTEQLSKAYADLKLTQQQLLHQEKMASLGQIAAGISHEIQNPLNFVNNFSSLSKELLDEIKNSKDENEKNELLDGLENNIEKIALHGNRASRIITSILRQSHHSSTEKQMTDINQLCDEFIMLAYQGMRSNYPDFNCEIIKNLDPATPKILTAPQDIARVLLNLFNNAFYAVKERSEIGGQKPEAYFPKVSLMTQLQNNSITISVKDNGNGIPEQIKQKIFEPFFTTKTAGNGTGLGLSISFDIIKMHGGEITVNSIENESTEFKITLPV
ncbi:MAG TPA: tetratricopeptide repeat-containing sensor histidine kinase [Bacteroidia bacterium]|nr:tetratricopeptide repeat-containing sensor histidine kinase [Bacteroidia bacterium]